MAAIFGSHLMTAAAYIVIIGGGVIVGISFCGCIGSVQERKCMIMTVSRVSMSICGSEYNRHLQ